MLHSGTRMVWINVNSSNGCVSLLVILDLWTSSCYEVGYKKLEDEMGYRIYIWQADEMGYNILETKTVSVMMIRDLQSDCKRLLWIMKGMACRRPQSNSQCILSTFKLTLLFSFRIQIPIDM
ncbi:hypothetical protein BDC45DRAFT_532052 [Circinella umbellata]|nr:hypothetical protein BDC45DRAFT_532052 [Circinella umbellata]